MGYESPGLYDANGKELSVTPGNAIPSGTKGILDIGSDSGVARTKIVDASGRQIIVGSVANGAAVSGAGAPNVIAGYDGTNVRTLKTDSNGVLQFTEVHASYPTYGASNQDGIQTPLLLGGTQSIAYLFHPAISSKRVEIRRIFVSTNGGGSVGAYTIRCDYITAQAATPGGTVIVGQPFDRSDAASDCIFRVGATSAPTRIGLDPISVSLAAGSQINTDLTSSNYLGKPISLRPNIAEGFEIRVAIGLALLSAARINIFFEWCEF